jgi:selenocysteine lyase/cysteine desulfurase
MMSTQPEALRLADALDCHDHIGMSKAAAELRRLQSVNAELLDALKLARLVVNPAHAYGIAIEAAIAKATGETK